MYVESEYWDPEIELMSRKELEVLQLKRLRQQIARCYHRSPLYKRKFKQANIHPDDVKTLSDISKLPFMTKGDLRVDQSKRSYTGYLVTEKKVVEAYQTSGSTGDPILNFWTEFDRDYISHITARTLWSMGLRSHHVVQNAFKYENWAPGIAVHRGTQLIGGTVLPIGDGKLPRQIEYLLKLKPNVLVSTPTLALEIGEKLQELGYEPEKTPLEFAALGGEPGAAIPATRAKLERLLGADVYDYYGLMEIAPTFASECREKAGLHWSEDCHLIEVVDLKTGEPVGEGEKGVLVITHLVKEACPMIRYWTGDITKLEYERCACGRTHARSPGGILGRIDDLIIYRGIKIYPSEIENILYSFPEVRSVQRITQQLDTLVVEFELSDIGLKKGKKNVEEELSKYLSECFDVTIHCVGKELSLVHR